MPVHTPILFSAPSPSSEFACFLVELAYGGSGHFMINYSNLGSSGLPSGKPYFVDYREISIPKGSNKYCFELKEYNTAELTIIDPSGNFQLKNELSTYFTYVNSFVDEVNNEYVIAASVEGLFNRGSTKAEIDISGSLASSTVERHNIFSHYYRSKLANPNEMINLRLSYEPTNPEHSAWAHEVTASFPAAAVTAAPRMYYQPINADAEERL